MTGRDTKIATRTTRTSSNRFFANGPDFVWWKAFPLSSHSILIQAPHYF
jgi:hypothetical protein